MKEQHEFQFAGVWVPTHVCELLKTRQLGSTAMALYIVIHALQGEKGCFASNGYLTEACGISDERAVQRYINRLMELGLVERKIKNNNRRLLRVVLTNEGRTVKTTGEDGKKDRGGDGKKDHHNSVKYNKAMSGIAKPDDGGFGLAGSKNQTAIEFDIETAIKLEEAVRSKVPSRTSMIAKAKPSTWADHIRRLRTIDEIPEDDIRHVMDWYTHHIGEEFVPEAYSGEAFRKKFPAIERQAKRGFDDIVEITPLATRIAKRLSAMGWPEHTKEMLPAATQACLSAYEQWCTARNLFVKQLERKKCKEDAPLLRFSKHLQMIMPPPSHFTEKWLEEVHQRVYNWDGWDGDLGPLVFRPEAKGFLVLGRRWATEYTGDPDRWVMFCKAIDRMEEQKAAV